MKIVFEVVLLTGFPFVLVGSAGILFGIIGKSKALDSIVERLFW